MKKIFNYLFIKPFTDFLKDLKNPSSNVKAVDKSYYGMDNTVETLIRNGERVPLSFWHIVQGYPGGNNPKYQPGAELYELNIANDIKREKDRLDALEKEKEEKHTKREI